jgi:membrane-associated phospholipid phosphatase
MEQILHLIEHYGYLVVFFGVMLESTGVPLPGETNLFASGFLAQRGHLDVGDAILFGILGAVAGDQLGYWVGREGGRPFVLRWGRYVRITPERLSRAEVFFARHGGKPYSWPALAAATGCLWLFGGLAEDGLTNDPIVHYDRAIAAYLHSLANPSLTTFFLVVTALGSIEILALVGVVVAVILARRRQWLYFWTWAAAVGGSALLNHLIKDLFARPRPSFEHPLLLETSYSFPSGHAMESFVVYGMLAYFAVLTLRSWRARTAVVTGVALLVILIGFSRMYVGVHYFSAVVAGYAAGGVWLSALITGAETIRRSKSRSNQPLDEPPRERLPRATG